MKEGRTFKKEERHEVQEGKKFKKEGRKNES